MAHEGIHVLSCLHQSDCEAALQLICQHSASQASDIHTALLNQELMHAPCTSQASPGRWLVLQPHDRISASCATLSMSKADVHKLVFIAPIRLQNCITLDLPIRSE